MTTFHQLSSKNCCLAGKKKVVMFLEALKRFSFLWTNKKSTSTFFSWFAVSTIDLFVSSDASRSAGCGPSSFLWVVSPYLPIWEAYGVTGLQAHALHTIRNSAHSCWAYPTFFCPGEWIARIHRGARLRAKMTDALLPCC